MYATANPCMLTLKDATSRVMDRAPVIAQGSGHHFGEASPLQRQLLQHANALNGAASQASREEETSLSERFCKQTHIINIRVSGPKPSEAV